MDTPAQKTIRIGKGAVGLVGLAGALDRVLARQIDEEEAVADLLAAVKQQNYIPPGSEQLYREALRREYYRRCGRQTEEASVLTIRVLGPGCVSCNRLKTMVIDLLAELDLAADMEDIHDLDEIWRHWVTLTPALVINNAVKCAGRMPAPAQVRQWLTEAAETLA